MHLKTCFEQYSCIKTIQLFFCFTTKVQRPTTRVLVMPKASHFARLNCIEPAQSGNPEQPQRILKMAEFGETYIRMHRPLMSYLLDLILENSIMSETLSISKLSQKFHRSYFSVLLPAEVLKLSRLICFIVGLSDVRMGSDQLVYVLLSVFGEKSPIFYLGRKIFPSRTQLQAKLQELRLSYFLFLLCPAYQFKTLFSRVDIINEKTRLMCRFFFFALQSSAQVWKQAATWHM